MVKKKTVARVLVAATLAFVVIAYYVVTNHKNSLCLATGWKPLAYLRLEPRDNTNVTVVTAFFDLGTYRKGRDPDYQRSPSVYLQWAESFLFIQNPVILFTDCKDVANLFRANFSGRNLRVVFVSDRSELFSFQQLPEVRRILSDPSYPKFYPNTVVPEYSCSQHAKIDVVDRALAWNIFRTEYFAWVDLGYFRDLVFRKKKFWIAVPADFDDRKVAAGLIEAANYSKDAEEIFKSNVFWIGGGMILASHEKYSRFVVEYRQAMQYFLAAGLVNTDQQLMYAMFKPSIRKELNVTTELQLFSWPLSSVYGGCWFYLGYYCYREE